MFDLIGDIHGHADAPHINIIQHYETLKQFQNLQEQYEEYLDWFQTLPLFYATEKSTIQD